VLFYKGIGSKSLAGYRKQKEWPSISLPPMFKLVRTNDGNNYYLPPTLDGWVYIDPIHGPLDGHLYTWAQYTPTPPRSLNYRRSCVQDWTTRKLTPPRSLSNRRSGVQD